MAQCFIALAKGYSAPWVLDADIRACFDRLDHTWLLRHILMDTQLLQAWLNAGYIEADVFHATEEGTPQGGIASPVLANMALDGLEAAVYRAARRRGAKVNVIRYADDVRHITGHQIPFPERRGSEEKTPGSTTYLNAKAGGNSSMPLKRRRSEGVYDLALQDPRDTVRATRPKPQSPAMEAYIP